MMLTYDMHVALEVPVMLLYAMPDHSLFFDLCKSRYVHHNLRTLHRILQIRSHDVHVISA